MLVAWQRFVLPVLRAIGRIAAAGLRFGERHITPARAVAATSLVAIGALAASQWLDYRSVSVGNDAYSGTVGIVAPPPEVSSDIAGHAHSWVMLPLALIAFVALVLALTGRRRAAFALVPVGIAAVAISLAVDAPKGLDEGAAAIAYEGATATPAEGLLDADRHRHGADRLRADAAAVPAPGAGRSSADRDRPDPASARAACARAQAPSTAAPAQGSRDRGKRKVQGAGLERGPQLARADPAAAPGGDRRGGAACSPRS